MGLLKHSVANRLTTNTKKLLMRLTTLKKKKRRKRLRDVVVVVVVAEAVVAEARGPGRKIHKKLNATKRMSTILKCCLIRMMGVTKTHWIAPRHEKPGGQGQRKTTIVRTTEKGELSGAPNKKLLRMPVKRIELKNQGQDGIPSRNHVLSQPNLTESQPGKMLLVL